jgi:N4-gp56 family major capsid protein
MADIITDGGTVYANLLANGYDKFLEYQLRSTPIFRQLVDKHPVNLTNVGPQVVLTIIKELANLAKTPLSETSDVAAVAPPAPSRVTVSVDEYGNAEIPSLRLRQLAFTSVDPALAYVLGKNMVDTLDDLVKDVLDSATHVLGKNATVVKSDASGFAVDSVASGDKFDSSLARTAVTLLRGRNAPSRDVQGSYLAIAHPDVVNDVLADTGWLSPHQYVDTANIYNAEAGSYLGARYIMSPRADVTANSGSVDVYSTYFLGRQAVVEAVIAPEHVVVGPQTDHLRRFFPMGWLFHGGWAVFRQESIEIVKSSSSVAGLS